MNASRLQLDGQRIPKGEWSQHAQCTNYTHILALRNVNEVLRHFTRRGRRFAMKADHHHTATSEGTGGRPDQLCLHYGGNL